MNLTEENYKETRKIKQSERKKDTHTHIYSEKDPHTYTHTHRLSPVRQAPSRADEAVAVQNTALHTTFNHVRPHHRRVVGVWVLSPHSLGYSFPGVAVAKRNTD